MASFGGALLKGEGVTQETSRGKRGGVKPLTIPVHRGLAPPCTATTRPRIRRTAAKSQTAVIVRAPVATLYNMFRNI